MNLEPLYFGFVSDFDIRYSNLTFLSIAIDLEEIKCYTCFHARRSVVVAREAHNLAVWVRLPAPQHRELKNQN